MGRSHIRPGAEGVQRSLGRYGQSRKTSTETTIWFRDGLFHGCLCSLVEDANRGLRVEDQSLKAMPAALVRDRLKSIVAVLNGGLLVVADDCGGMAL